MTCLIHREGPGFVPQALGSGSPGGGFSGHGESPQAWVLFPGKAPTSECPISCFCLSSASAQMDPGDGSEGEMSGLCGGGLAAAGVQGRALAWPPQREWDTQVALGLGP